MSIEIINGNIFSSTCQTLVNTVNCVGVMGAGVALECRLRYPVMFEKYCDICRNGQLRPGGLWLYKGGSDPADIDSRWILNFPTKDNWKHPSRFEYLHWGLDKFLTTYKQKGITSIAFPILGGLNGGLDTEQVIELMTEKLSLCDIPITIYKYSSEASDDVYDKFKEKLVNADVGDLLRNIKVRRNIFSKVLEAINNPEICQMNQLARVPGIGVKTMEILFRYVCASTKRLKQGELF